jgi:hypothetical protein
MPAENLNDQLVREENRIGDRIYRRSINTSVWNKLVPKETWPDGMSDSIQVLTMERNLPANIDTWASLETPNDASNNCAPTADVVPTGQTLRSYHLEQKAIESSPVCVNDTRNAFRTAEQLKAMYENLTQVTRYVWKRKAMLEYFRISEHKMVAAAGLPEAESYMPTIAATSVLTKGILDEVYMNLIAESAEMDGGSLGMQDGRPQFILVTDAKTSDKLKREDAAFETLIRSPRGAPTLLAPLGVDYGINGFYHTIDNLPRRFNFANDTWTEVHPYEEVQTTKGTKLRISQAYRSAEYTDSVVFLPVVFSFMVVRPISTAGSGTSWKAQSYMGDFKWLNVQNVDSTSPKYNPDNAIGFYRALIQTGAKPVHPEFGYVIRHKRCPEDIGLTNCPTPATKNDSSLSASDSWFIDTGA